MTATLERLEDEAERSGMKMGIAGSQRQYEPFTRSRAGEFVLKEGRHRQIRKDSTSPERERRVFGDDRTKLWDSISFLHSIA